MPVLWEGVYDKMRNALSTRLRVWNTKTRTMYPSFPLYKAGFCDYPELDNIVVMFGTGLKDRHGKEVYEGDIILTDFRWLVYFGENDDYLGGTVGWSVKCINTEKTYFIDDSILRGEIIGNIHENPELLELA